LLYILVYSGIEPFTKVDPKYSQGRFPNLFQKSPGGGYVQSVDELYTVAHSTLPALEELLYKLKGSLVENILEVGLVKQTTL
jgi:hypothetical protein